MSGRVFQMHGQFGKRYGIRNKTIVDPVEQHAKRFMQRAMDVIVGPAGSNLLACLKEIAARLFQRLRYSRRPSCHFCVKQLWGPAAEIERASPNAVRQSGKALLNICLPGQTPKPRPEDPDRSWKARVD